MTARLSISGRAGCCGEFDGEVWNIMGQPLAVLFVLFCVVGVVGFGGLGDGVGVGEGVAVVWGGWNGWGGVAVDVAWFVLFLAEGDGVLGAGGFGVPEGEADVAEGDDVDVAFVTGGPSVFGPFGWEDGFGVSHFVGVLFGECVCAFGSA